MDFCHCQALDKCIRDYSALSGNQSSAGCSPDRATETARSRTALLPKGAQGSSLLSSLGWKIPGGRTCPMRRLALCVKGEVSSWPPLSQSTLRMLFLMTQLAGYIYLQERKNWTILVPMTSIAHCKNFLERHSINIDRGKNVLEKKKRVQKEHRIRPKKGSFCREFL